VKEGFLKEYLEADQGEPKGEVALWDQVHETPIHGEMNTISGGFSGRRNSTSKRKGYARVVMSLKAIILGSHSLLRELRPGRRGSSRE